MISTVLSDMSRDPFMARGYNRYEGADHADSPVSVASPPVQSLPLYLDQAGAPVNLNYPGATPPFGSYGRNSFSLPLRGPTHATYEVPAVLGPTSHPREPYVPQNNFVSPQISPLHSKDMATSICDDRRFLVRNVDTDTEGLEVVQLFQVSHFPPKDRFQKLNYALESRVDQWPLLDYFEPDWSLLHFFF